MLQNVGKEVLSSDGTAVTVQDGEVHAEEGERWLSTWRIGCK